MRQDGISTTAHSHWLAAMPQWSLNISTQPLALAIIAIPATGRDHANATKPSLNFNLKPRVAPK